MKPLYVDHQATTPVDPSVLEAMLPFFMEDFGNSGSRTHPYGSHARDAVEAARESVAGLIGAEPRDIIFTSGATESNNIGLIGAAQFLAEKGRHIITCVTEHKSVSDRIAASNSARST